MKYLYGDFSDDQIKIYVKHMHKEIHKLLLYKDKKIKDSIFNSENDFDNYFQNLLYRYGGLNKLLKEPPLMIAFMSTLQAAYDVAIKKDFSLLDYNNFRKLILNAHGYLTQMFGEVR